MDNNKNIQPVSRNNNPLRSSSEQWLQYFKQAKIDLEEINKALLNNVETVDNENIKFCLKLTKGMNHYSKIGYIFSVLESTREKGKGMNEKELKNDSEALEILKTFAR